jgi:15-cis-phytoene desaturase
MVDIGPHVLTTEHRQFLALLQRLGTADHVLWQPQPLITLLEPHRVQRMRGSALPPPLHVLPNLPRALRSVSLRDLLSNLRVAWRLLRVDEARLMSLDRADALQWLRACGVRPRFIEWFWAPACLALLNLPLQRCSAAALARLARYLAVRSGYGFGFARGALADLFVPAARRAIEDAGGSVWVDARVTALALEAGAVQVRLADGRQLHGRAAVLALPPQALEGLAPPALGRVAAAFEPCPYLSTYLWFDRRLTAERFWARVDGPGLNLDFYDLSNIRNPGAPSLIAANCIHAHAAWSLDDQELIRRARAEVARFAPAAAEARLRHARVHRIPMAIASPLPGTEALRPRAATAWPQLWLAGDWTATGLPSSMESAARSAALAAEGVAAFLGLRVPPALPLPAPQGLASWLAPRHPDEGLPPG